MLNLIEPGDYNFSFNQKYLLEKLYTLDMYNFILYSFIVLVVLTLFSYCLINYYKNEKAKESEKKLIIDSIRHTMTRFNNLLDKIYYDEYELNKSENEIINFYYSELVDVINNIDKNINHIRKEWYSHLSYYYEYYKNKLEKENKPNI